MSLVIGGIKTQPSNWMVRRVGFSRCHEKIKKNLTDQNASFWLDLVKKMVRIRALP